MFECLDAKGKQIYTMDLVELDGPTAQGMNLCHHFTDDVQATVMAILSPNEIQVNPNNGFLPKVIDPSNVAVIDSFIDKLKSIAGIPELQEMLKLAEENFKKVPPKKASKKKESTKVEIDV